MISAAHFFVVPEVKYVAQGFLLGWAARAFEKPDMMDMLSVALEYPENWEGKNAMLLDFVSRIGPDWCDQRFSNKLSRIAVEYIVQHSQYPRVEKGNKPCFEEYFTFRNIVLWHAYQMVPVADTEKRSALGSALPGRLPLEDWRSILQTPLDIDGFLSDVLNGDSMDSAGGSLSSLLGSDIWRESLQQMLLHIDLSHIPALLLLKIVHPLKVYSHRQLLRALVHKAL